MGHISPLGSFKIALTAELGPLENGEIVDIKRLTTSIVVDNNREDIMVSYINRTINDMSYDQMRDVLFELMNNNLEELDNETLEVFIDSWQPDLLETI